MGREIVAINGEVFDPVNAKISVYDRGFLFGDAVYEVTRSYGSILFQLEPHVERLFRSAEAIGMDLEKTPSQVIEELYRLHRLVGEENKYVRWQVTRGHGPIGMSTHLAPHRNWVIYIKDVDLPSAEQYEKGVAIVTTDRLRNTKKALDPNIKSGNYLNNVLAFQAATAKRAFESVMVDQQGFVTEGTTSNIFRVQNGIVETPPNTSDILMGITRHALFDIAKKVGVQMKESYFTPDQLRQSDEVFLTSSTREVLPICQVDEVIIRSNGIGPVTRKLLLGYKTLIKDYCENAKKTHPWR